MSLLFFLCVVAYMEALSTVRGTEHKPTTVLLRVVAFRSHCVHICVVHLVVKEEVDVYTLSYVYMCVVTVCSI